MHFTFFLGGFVSFQHSFRSLGLSDDAAIDNGVLFTFLGSNLDHLDRLSKDAFFAAKILQKFLLMESSVAHLIGRESIKSAPRWVLELHGLASVVQFLHRVELGARRVALVAQRAISCDHEANGHCCLVFWVLNQVSESALGLHSVIRQLAKFDHAAIRQTRELAGCESGLVKLRRHELLAGRLVLHLSRVMAFGDFGLWLGHRCWVWLVI